MIAENISTVKIIQISLICKGISALGRRIWIFYQPVTSIQWHKMNSNGRLIEKGNIFLESYMYWN